MNGIRLHGIVSNGLHRWAHVLAHALGQSSILPWSMSMWPAILDFHENFRSADRHGGQDRSNLCLSPYESATEQAPCAKPPFCDATGAKPNIMTTRATRAKGVGPHLWVDPRACLQNIVFFCV